MARRTSSLIHSLLLAAALATPAVAQDVGDRPAATTRESEATATTAPATRPAADARARRARQPMQHALVMLAGDEDLREGLFDHVALAADVHRVGTTQPTTDGVVIVSPRRDFPLTGTWTSPTQVADFPFTELLPSWNVIVPDSTGVRFEVRTRDAATREWSPWLYIGYWGRITRERVATSFPGGEIDIDELVLSKPANAFEIRATLFNYDLQQPTLSPTLRRVAAAYSRKAEPSTTRAAARPTTAPATTTVAVPFRAQGVEDKAIRGSICSPTSTSMVLDWAGQASQPTASNALAIWDDDYALFGNWNRAVQYAGSLGYDAWLERFESMDDVRATLATGQPIVASIRFRKGEFPSNVLKQTAGHLIVVRGFDANGDLICNDPASKDRGERITYKADELARAWLLNAGGVGYIIRRPG